MSIQLDVVMDKVDKLNLMKSMREKKNIWGGGGASD